MRPTICTLVLIATLSAEAATDSSAPGRHASYRVLCAEKRGTLPFERVDIVYGPAEPGGTTCQWSVWAKAADAKPMFELRLITAGDLLAESAAPVELLRYQLAIPETGETLEYRNVHTGKALLPRWGDFAQHFLPRSAPCRRDANGFPQTLEYLGQVLTLQSSDLTGEWPAWSHVAILSLDPELSIGTGRNFKDSEGHRLPQQPERQNYHYVPFTPADYRVMIDAGMNLFCVQPNQVPYVRDESVFYIMSAAAKEFRYPTDLYRSNYAGNDMFLDEPTCIMVGDKQVHVTLKYFTDAAALLTKRVHNEYAGSNGAIYGLERELRGRGISLGDMRLLNPDIPSWETIYETAYYQLAGGVAGIVHEGRYELDGFNRLVTASTGTRTLTAEEMLRYHYAFLRGAARRFGKDWGTSIYGQADPKLSPRAMQLAYDMGARYLWFWTSDHDHHMPWPEQMELTRTLRRHAAEHPRTSIRGPQPTLDKVILIPYGYFLALESGNQRRGDGDLWWMRELDPEGQNDASQRYRHLIHAAWAEIIKAFDAGEDFDICVDDGKPTSGYRQVVRVSDH